MHLKKRGRQMIVLILLALALPSFASGDSCSQSNILQLIRDWSQGRASIQEVFSAIDLWSRNKPCPATETIHALITAGPDVFSGQIVELHSIDGRITERSTTSNTGEAYWSEPGGGKYQVYVPETLYTDAGEQEVTSDGTLVAIQVTYKPTYPLHVSAYDATGKKLETLDTELRLGGELLEKISARGNECVYRTVPGTYTVYASSQGYDPQEKTVSVGPDGALVGFVMQYHPV